MKRIVRLTESDLMRLVKRTINEMEENISQDIIQKKINGYLSEIKEADKYLNAGHKYAIEKVKSIEILDIEKDEENKYNINVRVTFSPNIKRPKGDLMYRTFFIFVDIQYNLEIEFPSYNFEIDCSYENFIFEE